MQVSNADHRSVTPVIERSSSRRHRSLGILTCWLFTATLLLFPAMHNALAADTGAAAVTASSGNTAALSPQEAQQLLNVLNDPKQRDSFTHTLSLMAKGISSTSATAKAAAPAEPANAVVSPNAVVLHTDLISSVSSLKLTLRSYLDNFLGLFSDLKTVGKWFDAEISNPQTRAVLLGTFWRAGLVIVVAMLIEWGASLALHKPLQAVTRRAESREQRENDSAVSPQDEPDSDIALEETDQNADIKAAALAKANGDHKEEINTLKTRADDQRRQIETLKFLSRVPYALGHFGLKLLPVLLFLGVAMAGSSLATDTQQAETVTETLAEAYAVARFLFVLLESALAPRSPMIRLAPVSDSTAHMLTRWWNFLVAAPSLVVCLSVVGGEFDLSERGTEAMIRAVILIEHIMIAIFIWRLRPIVARTVAPKRAKVKSGFWSFILTLVQFWWIPALFLDAALWLVWAAHLRGGYDWILRTIFLTVLIVAVTRLLAVLAYGWQDRLFRIDPAVIQKHPEVQERADRYYPFVRGALTALIVFIGFIGLTESWGLASVHFFFSSPLGSRLLSAVITLTVALSVAAATWEVVNALLSRQLEKFSKTGQGMRATRLKTVLPIIRTVMLALIIIIVLVTSLSQIGINVAPLLTGAGIMGAAVAFGSQSLVKDFITGFFMLVEDAIQVGDWVTAAGVEGSVEHLSIRTVRVRAFNGDLHIIPFSSVTSIANTGRDFNQLVIYQNVDLSEDISRVVKIMADTVAEMRQEDAFKTIIYSDYNDLGVNKSDSNGAITIGTIRTAAMMKWKVQREFYKRIANRMAAANIKFYTPTSYTASAPGTSLSISGELHAPADGHEVNTTTSLSPTAESEKPVGDSAEKPDHDKT
ncbi:MAG: mechanosensitive ion channel domain-containing protein [Acetobacter aceti]|uniref:Mechanosensitive ion channel protein MscS n=1 Tax=Acetobacter aceti TaxID=435 RepID=A0A1U9KEI5_ACEAC|nr:mechanosensitive ion channel domain-containing protein [Acetobacter aceti]AQS84223.1 mechanosensitive ion channel protein MscS [Acetobacter aceti]